MEHKKKHFFFFQLIHAHLVVIGPRWYRELHGRHESRQLQPSDIQLSIWQAIFVI